MAFVTDVQFSFNTITTYLSDVNDSGYCNKLHTYNTVYRKTCCTVLQNLNVKAFNFTIN